MEKEEEGMISLKRDGEKSGDEVLERGNYTSPFNFEFK